MGVINIIMLPRLTRRGGVMIIALAPPRLSLSYNGLKPSSAAVSFPCCHCSTRIDHSKVEGLAQELEDLRATVKSSQSSFEQESDIHDDWRER
jgi:hypothetical protein